MNVEIENEKINKNINVIDNNFHLLNAHNWNCIFNNYENSENIKKICPICKIHNYYSDQNNKNIKK